MEIQSKSVGGRADHSLEAILKISDSHFVKCKAPNEGGAIYMQNSDAMIYISSSVFRGCASESHGGAIWSKVLAFECHRSLYKICNAGVSCSYQTIYVDCKEKVSLENTIMTKNGLQETQGFSTLGIHNGEQNIKLLNSSFNHLFQWGAGLSIRSQRDSMVNLDMCTFCNNSQKVSDIFTFVGSSKQCELRDSNIIENSCPDSGFLIAAIARAYVYLRGCVLVNNRFGKLATIDHRSIVLFENCLCDVEQDARVTVHSIDSVFEKRQFKTINFNV